MSSSRAAWPDLVFASLLMIAGLLMLKYGLWHLANHQEVLGPLLAGSGAVVLGVLSIRHALGSRSPRKGRHGRRPSSSRSHWWCWVIFAFVNGSSFGSAQIMAGTFGSGETSGSSSQGSELIAPIRPLSRRYDLNRVGRRGSGGGFNVYSMEKEQRLGTKLASDIDRSVREVSDPVMLEYLNQLCRALSRQSDNRFPLTVKVIDSEELEIFGLPGGNLYLTTGLIGSLNNEAELAGLISHEIAHIAARHATKGASRRKLWNVVSRPAMFLGPFGILAWQFGSVAVPLKLSRNAELEADLLGLQYMYLAGYDATEFLRFAERAYPVGDRNPSRVAQIFSDYPPLRDRVRQAEAVISTFPARTEYLVDTGAFVEVKERIAPSQPALHKRVTDSSSPQLRRRTQ